MVQVGGSSGSAAGPDACSRAPAAEATEPEEDTVSRSQPAPVQPTKKMIEDHEVSHLPFRSWCAACVRGRAKSQPHYSVGERPEAMSTFSVDYGFFGSPGETPLQDVSGRDLPVLVAFDRKSKAVFAHPVPHKGLMKDGHVDDYPVKRLVQDLDRLGYKRVNGKSDQEPALLNVLKAVKTHWKGEWVPEKSPKGESKSNGEVERAVQTVHGIARTLKQHVEGYTRLVLDPKSPVLAWLVEYSAVLHYLFHRDSGDGMTPYQRVKGKEWQVALPAFGEAVDYKRHTRHKLEARWSRGVYLGVKPETTERIIGTPEGVLVVQSIRRVPEGERYDSDAISRVAGLPWKPTPSTPEDGEAYELPAPVELAPDCPEVAAQPTEAADQERAARRYYITQRDLEKYGYTDGCTACDNTRAGMSRSGIPHAPSCRARIEAAIAADPKRSTRFNEARARLEQKRPADTQADLDREDKRPHSTGGAAAPSRGVPGVEVQEIPMEVEERGQKRATEGGGEPQEAGAQAMGAEPTGQSYLSEFVEAEGVEGTLEAVLAEHRGRYLAEVRDQHPVCEQEHYDWDLEDDQPELAQDSVYFDDLSGKVLPEALVQEARGEEIRFIDEIRLWKMVPRPGGDTPVIGTRWVDVNKGDEQEF